MNNQIYVKVLGVGRGDHDGTGPPQGEGWARRRAMFMHARYIYIYVCRTCTWRTSRPPSLCNTNVIQLSAMDV